MYKENMNQIHLSNKDHGLLLCLAGLFVVYGVLQFLFFASWYSIHNENQYFQFCSQRIEKVENKRTFVSAALKTSNEPVASIETVETSNLVSLSEKEEEYPIDFNSKYYTFHPDGINGNPNVCDVANNVAWPYSNCAGLSNTGKYNKLICSSYGSSRFWEVNYPNEAYPLPRTWVIDLSNLATMQSGYFPIVRTEEEAISHSLISIRFSGGTHIAFLESIEPGHVVITETNLSSAPNEYGFRQWEGSSVDEWVKTFPGGKLNGFLLPI